MSASSNYLIHKHFAAIEKGRAFPLLTDYPPPEMPGYTLSVYGLVDSRRFAAVLLPDDYVNGEILNLHIPITYQEPVATLKLDSEDAAAVHELWSSWNGGVHDSLLLFTRNLGLLISHLETRAVLDNATVNKKWAGSARSAKPKKKKTITIAKARKILKGKRRTTKTRV